MEYTMIKELETLIQIANTLDSKGEYKLATLVDNIIKNAMEEWTTPDDPLMEEERQTWTPFPEGEILPAFKGMEPEGLEPGRTGSPWSGITEERVGPGGESEYTPEEEAYFEDVESEEEEEMGKYPEGVERFSKEEQEELRMKEVMDRAKQDIEDILAGDETWKERWDEVWNYLESTAEVDDWQKILDHVFSDPENFKYMREHM
jgi:hypothetical protein